LSENWSPTRPSHDPDIKVVGTAIDPYAARDKIKELNPDVLTLDLEMPRMDGLTFLKIVMEQRPLPVIVMSSLTQNGSAHALEALRLGAFDVLAKPHGSYSFGDIGPQLIARIKASVGRKFAAYFRTRHPAPRPGRLRRRSLLRLRPPQARPASAVPPRLNRVRSRPPHVPTTPAASSCSAPPPAAPEALREVLTQLPAGLPGIAVVQHIPPVFSKAFADRLNSQCDFEVREPLTETGSRRASP